MRRTSDDTSDKYSRAALGFLRMTGCWSDALGAAPPALPGSLARREQTLRRLKHVAAPYLMTMLTVEAFEEDWETRPGHSLNGLAKMLDAKRIAAMSNTLRKMILPAMTDAGWIEGFIPPDAREAEATRRNDIRLTREGLEFTTVFLDLINKLAAGDEHERLDVTG